MAQDSNAYQQKVGEVEQSARSLINSALYYIDDPSLPDSLSNARRCLETAKYVLEGLYIPSSPNESRELLARATENQWPHGVYEAWGFSNNVDDKDHPYYPI